MTFVSNVDGLYVFSGAGQGVGRAKAEVKAQLHRLWRMLMAWTRVAVVAWNMYEFTGIPVQPDHHLTHAGGVH